MQIPFFSIFWERRRRRKFLDDLRTCRHSEDDLLSDGTRAEFDRIISELAAAPENADPAPLQKAKERFGTLELPTHYGALRNFLDLFLVIGAVAFGLRGLYFQPFSIPTGSMQPTLYGIHYRTEEGGLALPLPDPVKGFLFASRRAEARVAVPGTLDPESVAEHGGFFEKSSFAIGGRRYTLPGTLSKVSEYADLELDRQYRPGDVLADGYLVLGDHLFVERFGLYLTGPSRGDVMVFNTEGLFCNDVPLSRYSGYYYVKRLAGMPGDTVKLCGSQLYVRPAGTEKFVPVQELEPRFGKVYSGKGGYQGHLAAMGNLGEDVEYTIPADHYFMLGDNSSFSMDSRFFGPVPRKNLVGRAWWVFWPFGRRWGRVDHVTPLNVGTGSAERGTFPVMFRQ